jgi:Domain of unknown function (DUF4126)
VHLVFDIFQGIGVAAAVGIRPFLPALVTGGLAAGDVEIHFNGTDYSFLQSTPFLLAVGVAAIMLALAEWRFGGRSVERRPVFLVLAVAAIGLGCLFFAGSLCRGGYAVWPGYVGGAICAVIAIAATQPLFVRVRARLDESTVGVLPLFIEIAAVLVAALSVVAPPVGPIALALLLWLLWAGRRREGQKYAGLRILR